MNILILNRHDLGSTYIEPIEYRLAREGHNVDFWQSLHYCDKNLSEYDAVFAHPVKEDFGLLYEEAEKRKEFKLIFFNAATLKINPNEQFKNKNVFFTGFPRPLEVVKMIESSQ